MPLLKGERNIGHNIEEMQKAGHPHKQAIAAGLHTAYDDFNSTKVSQAKKAGAVMAGDSYAMPTTAMTAADINKKAESYWNGENGNIGPAASEASAPSLAGTKVASIPVWRGASDEVSPTQSAPPDKRSDNLLTGPGAEMTADDLVEGSEAMETGEHQTDSVGIGEAVGTYHAGKRAGENLAEGSIGVDRK